MKTSGTPVVLGLALLCIAVTAGGVPWAGAAECPGIHGIELDGDKLVVSFHAPEDQPVGIVEAAAYSDYDGEQAPLWTGAGGQEPVELPRYDGQRDRLFSSFLLIGQETRDAIGVPFHVDYLPERTDAPDALPHSSSIKGMASPAVCDEAISYGLHQVTLRVDVSRLLVPEGTAGSNPFEMEGRTYHINTLYLNPIEREIRSYTKAGVRVQLVLENGGASFGDRRHPVTHPDAAIGQAEASHFAFNMTSEEGYLHYRAALEYLADRYSKPALRDGHVLGYIIGSDLQDHWRSYNMGEVNRQAFVEQYARALRTAYLTVRKHSRKIRVYVPLNNYWADTPNSNDLRSFRGDLFLGQLARHINERGDFPWHVSINASPEDLSNPAFWEDQHATLSFRTPRMTLKNIEVLAEFMAQSPYLFRGWRRWIILNDIVLSAPPTEDGNELQAAAYAYAYFKLSHLPEVEGFMLEQSRTKYAGAQLDYAFAGDTQSSPIAEAFMAAGTHREAIANAFALDTTGLGLWERAYPSRKIEFAPDLTPAITLASGGESAYTIVYSGDSPPPGVAVLQDALSRMASVELPANPVSGSPAGPSLYLGLDAWFASEAAEANPGATQDLKEASAKLENDGVLIKTIGENAVIAGDGPRGDYFAVQEFIRLFLEGLVVGDGEVQVEQRSTVTMPEADYAFSSPFMWRSLGYVARPNTFSGCHNFYTLVPPDKYFEDHPEYFSLIDGERRSTHVNSQLCFTNPEVQQLIVDGMVKWAEEYPDHKYFWLGQQDGPLGTCECDECRDFLANEGNITDLVLNVANKAADAIREVDPDKWVSLLIYEFTMAPPAKYKPRENVLVQICQEGDVIKGLELDDAAFRVFHHGFPERFLAWRQMASRMQVWHYIRNFAHPVAPNPNLMGLARDIKWYARNGADAFYACGGAGIDMSELRGYYIGQLLWNPQRDPETVLLEFCRGYYGEQADEVLEFLDLMHEAAMGHQASGFGVWKPELTAPPWFVDAGLDVLNQALEEAATEEARKRLTKLLVPLWYMQIISPDEYGVPEGDREALLEKFRESALSVGITNVYETPECEVEIWDGSRPMADTSPTGRGYRAPRRMWMP